MRPEAELDIECFHNWFEVGITDAANGWEWDFQLVPGSALDIESIVKLLQMYTIVTFNGTHYDVPMLALALTGATNEQLKIANDVIINEHINCWAFFKKFNVRPPHYLDHIDLSEPAPGVKLSLKQYAGRCHAPTMQETVVDFNLPMPVEKIPEEIIYCRNDRKVTRIMGHGLKSRMDLRRAINAEYPGLDVRSKSDAQIAETIIKSEWTRLIMESEARLSADYPYGLNDDMWRIAHSSGNYPHLGVEYARDWNNKPQVIIPHFQHGTTFKCKVPDYIEFVTDDLKDFLQLVRTCDFFISNKDEAELMGIDEKKIKTGVLIPPELKGRDIHIGGATYRVGIGGLHSQESKTKHIAVPGKLILRTADVRSYYPSLILNAGMYPPQMGPLFLTIYQTIYTSRLEAKSAAKRAGLEPHEYKVLKTKEGGYKIVLNGTFGKLFSRYSTFYAPELGIAVTMAGQLSLLMLIERLHLIGARIVSANTDGIEILFPVEMEWMVVSTIRWWEQKTGLGMDQEDYAALYSRDVNNYISVHFDGTTKRKGVFRESGLEENKHPDCDICADAVVAFLTTGTPLITTIMGCKDIRKFVRIRGVSGGGVYLQDGAGWRHITQTNEKGKSEIVGVEGGVYLASKAVRWYYGRTAGHIAITKNGNKVAGSDGATPVMKLPEVFPEHDINYQTYLDMAEAMLEDIGFGVQH